MRIIDILALISYPLLIINAILLFVYYAKSAVYQIKSRVISLVIAFTFFSTLIFSVREVLSTLLRYLKINGIDQATINIITDWYIVVSFLLALFFTGINFSLKKKNRDRLISFKRRDKK